MTGLLSILLHCKPSNIDETKVSAPEPHSVQFCIQHTDEQSSGTSPLQERVKFAVLPTRVDEGQSRKPCPYGKSPPPVISKNQLLNRPQKSYVCDGHIKGQNSNMLRKPLGHLNKEQQYVKQPPKITFALGNLTNEKNPTTSASRTATPKQVATTCRDVLEDVLKKENDLKVESSDEEEDDNEFAYPVRFQKDVNNIGKGKTYRPIRSPKPPAKKLNVSSFEDETEEDDDDENENDSDFSDEEADSGTDESEGAVSESSLSNNVGERRSPLKSPSSPIQTAAPPSENLIPDDTDFVPGTFDEDQPACLAFASSLANHSPKYFLMVPQDIDPTFPDSDSDDEFVNEKSSRAQRSSAKAKWNPKHSSNNVEKKFSLGMSKNSRSPPVNINRRPSMA
ncbi:DUF2457 family conserved fungal protein [Schizosaccharomyces osmophilus]|uniref:DUF2457 family conserved fungal protein n=1 Tax=Schizosaccharomyces osmophilus TaxID=2545709 RepID=A0AAE9WDC0_9SCHI|nr:DUF2457 family conserved fungal protein [Schizosaccharomyces osmophilus]WBW73092.1 DUF2457 family conserved fungal protein [Schizosaccharomyces osmophilus]